MHDLLNYELFYKNEEREKEKRESPRTSFASPNPPSESTRLVLPHARTTELMLGFEPQQINYDLRSIDHVFRPTCFTYGDARSGGPLSYITYLKPCLTAHPQIPSGFQREGASRDDLRYAYPVKIQG